MVNQINNLQLQSINHLKVVLASDCVIHHLNLRKTCKATQRPKTIIRIYNSNEITIQIVHQFINIKVIH